MLNLLSNFITSTYAQTAAAGAKSTPNAMASFIPFALIFVIFYFLMIKPQKKKLVEEQNMIKELDKGAEIYTKSGMIGTIVGITEKIVTLEVSEGVKLKLLKSQIGGLASQIFEKESDKKNKK